MTREFWKYYNELKNAQQYTTSLLTKICIAEKIKKLERIIEMNNTYNLLIQSIKSDIGLTCEFSKQGCTKLKPCSLAYCDKFQWIINKAKDYSKVLNVPWQDILNSWEKERTYWWYNYYNNNNQPDLKNVHIFETLENFHRSIGNKGFKCPICNGITQDPYECEKCHWKIFGFFNSKNDTHVYIKELLKSDTIFTPIAWEVIKHEAV